MAYEVRVSNREVKFPTRCPCCGENTDLSYQHFRYNLGQDIKNANVTREISIDAPYCNRCKKHANTYHSDVKYGFGIISVIAAIFFGGVGTPIFYGIILIGIVGFCAIWKLNTIKAEELKKKNCCSTGWAMKLGPFYNFSFYNKDYANEFAFLNDSHVTSF